MNGLSDTERDEILCNIIGDYDAPGLWASVEAIVAPYRDALARVEAIHARDGIAHLGLAPRDTGATGWHTHANRFLSVWSDEDCPADHRRSGSARIPVLVVDPAEARETIARAIWESDMAEGLTPGALTWESEPDRATYLANADAVLAALGGQEGGQP